MAELQPPESTQINGNGLTATTTVSGGSLLPAGAGGGASTALHTMTSSETVGSKRQRRPSVRLGDLGGDQTYDSLSRRAPKPWKNQPHNHHHHNHQNNNLSVENRLGRETGAKISSKTRPLVNFSETLESDEREREGNLEAMAIGSWKLKESSKKQRGGFAATKRVRSNWASSKLAEGEEKYSGGEDIENDDGDGGDGGGGENSDSPVDSMDERENLYNNNTSRRQIRGARVSVDRHNHNDGVELLSGPSDTEAREWNGHGGGGGGGGGVGEDGVRVWLNGLGLGRYAPVFEIHEVDDEVLPMLTLEDLKDMGINAVGSRRKMFCAIQKLGKGFS